MTALHAEQALTLMHAHPADVAFCDIVMPGHDGVWLIDQLRAQFPQTAIVIATGLTKMDRRARQCIGCARRQRLPR